MECDSGSGAATEVETACAADYATGGRLRVAGTGLHSDEFNDLSAIGAVQAIKDAGLRVPEDISVIGFDDIQSAGFQSPALTTIRQPLRKMGLVAAESLLRRISGMGKDVPPVIRVEPQLVVRGTTAACRIGSTSGRRR
ncbi:MAG: hypothetical protein DMG81_16060 [Acidobacteria bacterium]|nr:MAG: hypothetical protein DMG81_16060 [Acidobacteriota bacterium]